MTSHQKDIATPAMTLGLLLIWACAAPRLAYAAWDIVPRAQAGVETNDNFSLSTAGDDQASRAVLDVRGRFSNYGQRGFIYGEPRIRADYYGEAENKRLESNDLFFRTAGRYSGQLVTFTYGGDFDSQSVLGSELVGAEPDDPDVDDPVDVDTGRLGGLEQDRERINFRPRIDFAVSERNSLRLEAQWIDVQYTEAELSGRTSFQNALVAAGIVRRLDARNEVSARFFSEKYEAVLNQNVTDTFGVEGQFSRPLTANWNFALTGGVERSDFVFLDDGEIVDNAAANFTYRLSFRNRTPRNTFNIDLQRRLSPNANGYVAQRDELRAFGTRLMSQRVRGSLGFRYTETKTLDNVSANDARDYLRFELGANWAMTQTLSLDVQYFFTSQRFVNQEVTRGESNRLYVGINYSGQPGPRP